MTPFSSAVALVALLGISGHAATNDIESGVLRFPEIAAGRFRPDVAAECANTLILAGRDSSKRQTEVSVFYAALSSWKRAMRSPCVRQDWGPSVGFLMSQ